MSRSASSRITSGFLPPISSWKRPNRAAIPVATPTPTASGARERDAAYARIVHQPLADHAAGADHQVEHALGHAGARDDLGKGPGARGHELGGLAHDRAPIRQRRRDLPRRDRDREVPWRDDADHPERLTQDVDVDAGADAPDVLPRHAQCLAREEPKDLGRALHLADPLGPRLPLLPGELLAELLGPGGELEPDGLHRRAPLLRRRHCPGRRRRNRRIDRGVRLRGVGGRVLADHIGQVGRIAILERGGSVDPVPRDQVCGSWRGSGAARLRRCTQT